VSSPKSIDVADAILLASLFVIICPLLDQVYIAAYEFFREIIKVRVRC
jgi:hypothetical protein